MNTRPEPRPSFSLRGVVIGLAACAIPSTSADAQSLLLEPRVVSAAPGWSRWSFSDGLPSGAIDVREVSQVSLPFSASFSPNRDWRIGLSGGYTTGSVMLGGTEAADLSLSGLTDIKIRTVGRLFGERLWLTLGVNLPTGLSGLSDEEATAVRVLGAPALRLATPTLGSGLGFIAGPVFTGRIAGWSVGAGVSLEIRNAYTPLESTLASGGTTADLDPAEAVHFSFGFDKLVGSGKLSLVLSSDVYGTDIVTLAAGGDGGVSTDVKLGPSVGARGSYRTATQRVRDLRVDASMRWRSEFSRESVSIAGSGGSYFDAGVTAVVGPAGGLGWSVAGLLSRDSGLDVDATLATAAMTRASLSVGPELTLGRNLLQPYVLGGIASVDTGNGGVTGSLLGFGVTLRADW